MQPDALTKTPLTGRSGRQESESHAPCLDIEIDEDAGSVRVYDPRLFHTGSRLFCRRLLETASRQPGIEKAEIDLTAASCRFEFERGSATAQSMAHTFCIAVQQAATDPGCAERTRWWRPTPRWSSLTAYRLASDVSFWETLEAGSGRLRLRNQGLTDDRARLSHLADTLAGLEGVEGCRVSRWFRTITIAFCPGDPVANGLVDRVERIWENVFAAGPLQHGCPNHDVSQVDGTVTHVSTGLARLKYLTLAGGAFAMTLVGLVVPGVPTVPCLLATSYYLARSSPRLNERLRRTVFFGPILYEWEQFHGLSWPSKCRLIGLTIAIVAVTVALTPMSPVVLVLILLISSLCIYGLIRSPVHSSVPLSETRLEGPFCLALPAP
jgi:uncharacterized membrane protein YbaN (DUF454 family)